VKFGAGVVGAQPNAGTFTITSSISGTSSAIAYNASASAVATALSALGGLASVAVTSPSTGTWYVDSGATANPTLALTGNTAALAPDGSVIYITKTQTASATTPGLNNRWILQVAKALPILRASGWTAFDSVSTTSPVNTAGSSTVCKSFDLEWNADAIDGATFYTLVDKLGASFTIGPIPYNASSTDVTNAFDPNGEGDNTVTCVQNGAGSYTVTLIGTNVAFSNVPTLTVLTNTLQVPIGLQGVVTTSTAGASDILATDSTGAVTLEIEISEASGQIKTAVQVAATISADLIGNTPGQATGNESWIKSGDIHQGKTLRVDSVFGSDSTGTRQFPLDKPFLTLGAAKTAASSGDTIVVGPGTYNENDLAKSGVRWHFMSGAKIIYTGTPTVGREFIFGSENGDSLTDCYVTGSGHFEWAAGGAGYVCLFQNDNIIARVFGLAAISDGSDTVSAAGGVGVDVVFDFDDISATSDCFYVAHTSGMVSISAKRIDCGASLLISDAVSGAIAVVDVERATCAKIAQVNDGSIYLNGQSYEFSGTLGVDHQGGDLYVSGPRVTTTNANGVIADILATGLRFHSCVLVAGASVTNGITASGGAMNYRATASAINKTPHANATNIIAGGLIIDTDVA
jgi:hypothetical protein